MATALLTCPICSQPGFSTIESLRHGLISAATRQLVCPVCQDILLGLDKFTIHLFSHSMQHDYIEKSPLPTRNERKKETINVQEHVRQSSNDQVTQVQRQNLEEEEESEIQNLSSKSVDVNKPRDIAQIRYNEPMSEFLQRNRRFLPSGQFAESRTSVPSQVSGTSDQVFKTCNEYNNGGIEEIINMNKKEHENNLQLRILKENRNMAEATERQCSVSLQTAFQVDHSNVKDMPLDLCNTSNSSASTVPRKVDCVDRNMTEILTCEFCKFSFPDPSILEIHRQLVHRNGGFTKSSNVNKELAKGEEDQRQFACHLCQKAFKMRGSLMIHLRVAHGGIGGGKMARNQSELEQQIDIRSFTCNICGKSFKKEQHLSQHVKTHEGKQWECDVCSKLFTTKYFLKKHKRLHTGEMPYSCMTCNKTFTFQQSYHKHLLYHSDEKPHVCSECDRAFKELSTLHNHQRIHTGEKPFACETCGCMVFAVGVYLCLRLTLSYCVS